MLKYISLLLFSALSVISASAQPNIDKKRDFNWLTGYGSRAHLTRPQAGTTLTDFNQCSDTAVQRFNYVEMDFNGVCPTISDENGRLICYSNGYTICDSLDRIIENGDSLVRTEYTYPNGSYIIQGGMILPKPNNNHIFYMIHHSVLGNNYYLKYRNYKASLR